MSYERLSSHLEPVLVFMNGTTGRLVVVVVVVVVEVVVVGLGEFAGTRCFSLISVIQDKK